MQILHSNALSPEQARWPEHMARALTLAKSVLTAAPNPRVGCVLVAGLAGQHDEQIAEGWHKGAGLPHAEPEALAQVQGKAPNATAFVTPLGGGDLAGVVAALGRATPFLRHRVGDLVELKYVPRLSFEADRALDHAAHIQQLLARPEVARDLDADDDEDGPDEKGGEDHGA